MSRGLFITGTGTDVGKTYVTGLIVKKLHESGARVGYYKAAMSGNVRDAAGNLVPGDAQFVKTCSGIPQPLSEMCPYVYERAVSPHLASRLEGNPVRLDVVRAGYEAVCRRWDLVAVEGSGGILCPLHFDGGEELWLEDVVRALGLGCLIVADAGLGTINSVVLTTEYLRAKNIPVRGVIFNRFHPGDVMEEDNARMCAHRASIPVLGFVGDGARDLAIDARQLQSLFA